jgi:ABC-type branched-subunit amino acid transport system ATPase component
LRFGGLVAVNALSFTANHGDITAALTERRRQTTVFNCTLASTNRPGLLRCP